MSEEEAVEDQEPSIEEILTSIRQIISDEDEEENDAEADVEIEPEPEPQVDEVGEEIVADDLEDEEEIIELNDVVEEPEAEPEIEAEPEVDILDESVEDEEVAASEPEVDVDLQDAIDPEPEEEIVVEEAVEEVAAPAVEDVEAEVEKDELDSLLTQSASAATYDGFSQLVKKTAVETNGITLEAIVRSELSPLLREWLDKNLPSIIERLVQEELERISKRVLDD